MGVIYRLLVMFSEAGSEGPVLLVGVVFGRGGCRYPMLYAVRGLGLRVL